MAIGNWIARISGYGTIGFWQCGENEARKAAEGKAEWEGGRLTFRAAKDTDEDNAQLAVGRAGCYEVGERKE